MGKTGELLARARKDIELATKYKKIRDYVTANLLYNSAMKKVLSALFITKTRKTPPAEASVEYLARAAGVPEEVSMYIKSMEEHEPAQPMVSEFIELGPYEENSLEENTERQAFFLDGLVTRLLDYVLAYSR